MLRSSKNADQRKQWWYRVAGYSAVSPSPVFIKNVRLKAYYSKKV